MIKNKIIYDGINSLLNLIINILPLIIIFTIFALLSLSTNYLFLSAFTSTLIYTCVIYITFYIISMANAKKNKLSKSNSTSADIIKRVIFSILGFMLLIWIGLIAFITISFYTTSPKYIKTEIFLPINELKYEITNLPINPSLNNFLLRKFWENSKLEKKVQAPLLKQDKTDVNFFDSKDVLNGYIINEGKFNLFNLFRFNTSLAIGNEVLIKDKSLLDTFTRNNQFGKKDKNCFIDDLDEYFYNNEFKLQINSNKIVFYSLYAPPYPVTEFKAQVLKIIKECKK